MESNHRSCNKKSSHLHMQHIYSYMAQLFEKFTKFMIPIQLVDPSFGTFKLVKKLRSFLFDNTKI